MEPHKYDNRGASEEGKFAEALFKEICGLRKQNFLTGNLKEDCAGVDGYLNGKKIDIKARKNKMPINTAWVELAKAGGVLGTGWVYSDKLIAQLMIYSYHGYIGAAKFGIYHTNDLVELIKDKVNFDSKASKGVLYELYTRWFNKEHRGTMTVVSYEDIESLKSFKALEVPREWWGKLIDFYHYNH